MADKLEQAAMVLFMAAGVFLVCSVFLWVKFHIPMVVGDLSGRTARKSIAKMREDSERPERRGLRLQMEAATEPLRAEAVTEPLRAEAATEPLQQNKGTNDLGKKVMILEEVVLIHTDEVIGFPEEKRR